MGINARSCRGGVAFLLCLGAVSAHGAIIGFEGFAYPDGFIDAAKGGSNWNRAGGVSDWNGTAAVINGQLITSNASTAFREYGGDESTSAVRATGQVFFRFTISFGNIVPDRAVLRSFEFGTQTISFGRFLDGWGYELASGGSNAFARNVSPNTATTIIAAIDFQNHLLAMWVDPDNLDQYDQSGGTADVRGFYNGTNWSTRIGLHSASSSSATVRWDNITVATMAADVGLLGNADVPEPGTSPLLLAGSWAAGFRRRSNSYRSAPKDPAAT